MITISIRYHVIDEINQWIIKTHSYYIGKKKNDNNIL